MNLMCSAGHTKCLVNVMLGHQQLDQIISKQSWRRFLSLSAPKNFVEKPRPVWGLRQVGLQLTVGKPGLRGCSLTTTEVSSRKWIPDSHLAWVPFGQSEKLSKTTKLILLDSLLQEVCIKSGLAGRSPVSSLRLSVCHVQSQSFFIQCYAFKGSVIYPGWSVYFSFE